MRNRLSQSAQLAFFDSNPTNVIMLVKWRDHSTYGAPIKDVVMIIPPHAVDRWRELRHAGHVDVVEQGTTSQRADGRTCLRLAMARIIREAWCHDADDCPAEHLPCTG